MKYVLLIQLLVTTSLVSGQQEGSLVSALDLKEQLDTRENLQVVDIRDSVQYAEGHITGAVNIPSRKFYGCSGCETKGLMATSEELEARLGKIGLTGNLPMVIYDDRGGANASRLWWIMKYYGYNDIRLLDGGIRSWVNDSLPVVTDVPGLKKSEFRFPSVGEDRYYAGIEEVIAALDDSNTVIIDTRTLDEYEGRIQKDGASRAGRIPGSIFMDWASSVNYHGDQRFKDSLTLVAMFADAGITPDKKIITYCQSGTRSAHTVFVLTELLGFEDVKNYDGSWIEWSARGDLAIDTGAIMVPVQITLNEAGMDSLLFSDSNLTQMAQVAEPGYWEVFKQSFGDFARYTWDEITFNVPNWYENYFWMLTLLSLVVWLLEIAFPWRKDQPIFRKDFWLDFFYMYFNFYIFKIIIFMAFSNVTARFFTNVVGGDLSDLALVDMSGLPEWLQLVIFFVGVDFIQWFTHVMLHRFDVLWRFHKVHHSVEQMGFAAHLRFHWMENVFYTPMKFIAMMLLGNFGPDQAFIVYYISIVIGHLNHANLNWSYGPLKYIFNNPKMHIWHHAMHLPENRRHGVNFGISLSLWDYIFRTNYIPRDGRDIKLGFKNLEKFPKKFWGQLITGFKKTE